VHSLPQITVWQRSFEMQMRYLSEHYKLLRLSSFADLVASGERLPPRTAAVTFDDGWRDNYLYAFPIMQKYGIPATIFLTTGFVGTDRVFWSERLRFLLLLLRKRAGKWHGGGRYAAGDLPTGIRTFLESGGGRGSIVELIESSKDMDDTARNVLIDSLRELLGHPVFPAGSDVLLDWDQVREMSENGIEFGSHTESHGMLTRIPPGKVAEELSVSRRRIEEELGRPVEAFAYPDGDCDDEVVAEVASAGYKVAVTTAHGINTRRQDPLQLKRINASEPQFSGPGGEFSLSRFAANVADCL